MTVPLLDNPSVTIAVALAAGTVAQALARHARLPGIVLLLGTGVLLGPEVLGLVRPDTLGETLHALIGFAVAVILFEGGMNLDIRRLRREGQSIRRLVTVGAAVTAVGGTLAARSILGWDWSLAALFGSLVIVTGPTVINPLLRRIRVTPKIATVLEAEGVFGDAIGAIVAVITLEIVLKPSGMAVAHGGWEFVSTLVLGAVVGVAGGLVIGYLLRFRHVVPDGLENIFTLSLALVLFQVSNGWIAESGIVVVSVAGMVVGNFRSRALEDLREFKEQLTVLFIGMLFVLLAADVRLDDIRALGWPGVATVVALMVVVRPLDVAVSTWGSDLTSRERAFLAWLAPRGIVAAAVSSLFASRLDAAGIPGGHELRALVFLVIAVTVLVGGLSGGMVARLLGVARKAGVGYVVLGASALARALAHAMRRLGEDAVLIDTNPDACTAAQDEGLRALHGSAFKERIALTAQIDGCAGALGLTSNDEVNLLFVRMAREDYRVGSAWVALRRGHVSVTPEMVHGAGAAVLFGAPRNLDLWAVRLEREIADVEHWSVRAIVKDAPERAAEFTELLDRSVLPLVLRRGRRVLPVDDGTRPRKGDEVGWIVFREDRDRVATWFEAHGWTRAPDADAEPPPDGDQAKPT